MRTLPTASARDVEAWDPCWISAYDFGVSEDGRRAIRLALGDRRVSAIEVLDYYLAGSPPPLKLREWAWWADASWLATHLLPANLRTKGICGGDWSVIDTPLTGREVARYISEGGMEEGRRRIAQLRDDLIAYRDAP